MRLIGDLVLVGFGSIKNARFENLTSDPSNPTAGQLWFNSVENVYKGFNGTEVVTLAVGGKLSDLQAELDATQSGAGLGTDGTYTANSSANYINNATSLADADNKLDAAAKANADAISAEVTRATGAEGTLTTNLAAEVTRATAAEDTLTTNLAAEVTRAQAAEGQLTSDLAAEVTRAQAAEGKLTTDLANEVTRATGAEGTLTTNLAAEVTRATAAEGVLTTNLDAEVTRAQGAEGVLTTNLAAEVTRATAAEDQLNSDLQAEVDRATSAEGGLNTRLTAVETSYVNKDGSVAFTGNQSMGGNLLTNVGTPVNDTDAANKAFVIARIGDLGNAFNYVGTVEGGEDEAAAFDLSSLANLNAGDYYKVTATGFVKETAAGTPFFLNAGDSLVKNITADGWDKFDNTDPLVSGEASFIDVTGSADVGYVVSANASFKGRVSTLETDLAAEVTRATGAEAQLTSDLAAEVARATTAEGALTTAINNEAARAEGAETVLQGNIDAEVTRAQAAEGVLTTNLAAEVTRATAAEDALTTNLAAEVTRAQDAEGVLTTNLAAEVTRAQGAESTLTTNLAAEVTRATAAEGVLTTNLAAEVTRAQAAESALQAEVDAIEVAAGLNADGTMVAFAGTNYLDTQVSLRAAVVALDTAVKAVTDRLTNSQFVYDGTVTAASTHVVPHNLGQKYGQVVVVDANDKVIIPDSITFDSASQLTVQFITAVTCRVIFTSPKL